VRKIIFLLMCVCWCVFVRGDYIFEPLFEAGGRVPIQNGPTGARLLQSVEEFAEVGLAPGTRGVILVGDRAFFDAVLPSTVDFPQDFIIFALDMATHASVMYALARSIQLPTFTVTCTFLFVDGAVRLLPKQQGQFCRQKFWQQCVANELLPQLDSERGAAWIADYIHKIAQYLYSGFQNAYHGIIGIKELL
jgi:hypothetical protein